MSPIFRRLYKNFLNFQLHTYFGNPKLKLIGIIVVLESFLSPRFCINLSLQVLKCALRLKNSCIVDVVDKINLNFCQYPVKVELKVNLNGNYPYSPNYLQFLKRPHPHSVIILCAWYTIWVLIPIKSIVSGIHNTLRPLLTSQTHLLKGAHLVIEKKTFYTYSVGCHPSLYIDSDPPVSIELFKKAGTSRLAPIPL